jgi:hypothetical protein
VKARFPLTLKLLPGLRWTGKMRIREKLERGYLVDWDAEDPSAVYERCVMDRSVLSATQIEDWTGVKLP